MTARIIAWTVLVLCGGLGGCATVRERTGKLSDGENFRDRIHTHCRGTVQAAAPANLGTVALEGFDSRMPLTIPPQGLTLAEALNNAGLPMRYAVRVKVNDDFVVLPAGSPGDFNTMIAVERAGVSHVTYCFAVKNGPLANLPLQPNDVLRLMRLDDVTDPEAVKCKLAFETTGPGGGANLSSQFSSGPNATTELRFAVIDRVVEGTTYSCIYPSSTSLDGFNNGELAKRYSKISFTPDIHVLSLDDLPLMTDLRTTDLARRVLAQARRRVPAKGAIQLPRLEPILHKR